jgi:bis(5'-nucleosyl)-tetraphosphatase (symmetrical)
MPVYAIGDIQGCYAPLQALLARMRFDPARDALWFTGDLVNRGPQSAEVLRFVRGLGERAVVVLGNHDLHLLAVAAGARRARPQDTFADVLAAPDAGELIGWLRARPLLHHDDRLGYTLVHAALHPHWDLDTARRLAAELEAALRGAEHAAFFARMYGDTPDRWDEALTGAERLRVIVNVFTRLRYCTPGGRMDLAPVGPPSTQPAGLLPWFQAPGRRSRDLRIVFGHWSLLGPYQGDGVLAIDTGCLWGRQLTAARLDVSPPAYFHVDCPRQRRPDDD